MSKFLFAVNAGSVGIGFEDAEIEAAMNEDEQVISVQESTADQAEIESDLATVERLEEQAAGLEDLAAAADQVQEATEGEVMLADVAAELATVGTDAEVEVFETPEGEQPALEHFVGKRISTEGIKDMAKKFWDAIKRLVSRIWEKLLAFYRRITDQVPGVVKQAKKLSARADSKRGAERKEEKTKLGSEGRSLVVDDKAPTSYSDIASGLENLSKVATFFLTKYPQEVVVTAGKIADAIGSFDIKSPGKSLRAVVDACDRMQKADASFNKSVSNDKRFTGKSTKVSLPLPGNKSVFSHSAEGEDSGTELGLAASVRSSYVALMGTNEKAKEHNDIEVATLTPAECDSLADKVIDLCGLVKEFNEKHRRDLEKARDKMKSSSDKATSKVTDETNAVAMRHYQSAVSFNSAYTKWASSPFTQLTSLVLTTCRAAIAAGNKSLSNYGS